MAQGALAGKTGGYFFSTASQGGGQETTALTGDSAALCHTGVCLGALLAWRH